MLIIKSLFIFTIGMLFNTSIYADTKVTYLNFWIPFSGGDARPMQMIVDKFNSSHSDINVKVHVIRWSDYYTKLDNSFKADKQPEVAIIHSSLLKPYIKKEQLTAFDSPYINWQNFSQRTLSSVTLNKKYYALPLDIHPLVLYYNKKYLKEAKLLDKQGNIILKDGLDNYLNFLKQLKENLPKDIKIIATPNQNIYPFWIWYSAYHQISTNKGYINNNKAMFNNEAGKKAMQVLQKIKELEIWDEDIHDEKGYNLFKYNKAAIMMTGVWATWSFKQNKKLDFGVHSFPLFFDKPAVFGDSHTLVIPKQKKQTKKDASMMFCKYLSTHSDKWALSGQVPANISVTNSKKFKRLPYRELYLESAKNVIYYPQHEKIKACNDIMVESMLNFLQTNITKEETLNQAEQKINNILGTK